MCCTFTSYRKRNRKLGIHGVLRKVIYLFIQLLIYIDLTSQQTFIAILYARTGKTSENACLFQEVYNSM